MINKVEKLGHIGRVAELRHRAEPMKKMSLLFARNGMGKSTICAVLRSDIAQDAKAIDERVHQGSAGLPWRGRAGTTPNALPPLCRRHPSTAMLV